MNGRNYALPSLFWDWQEPESEKSEPVPGCPISYRVATLAEAEQILGRLPHEGFWIENAGRELKVDPRPIREAAPGYMRMLLDGNPVHLEAKGIIVTTAHQFVETGARWSYCKVCDCEGRFDFESGTFKPV